MFKLKCQCEAARDGNCHATLILDLTGEFAYIRIEAPHISREQYGGELGVYIKTNKLLNRLTHITGDSNDKT